jgi:hypothetical protein
MISRPEDERSDSCGSCQGTITVWTAKRILILVVGLVVTLCSFATYTLYLGAIDGVQPIGPEKLPREGPEDPDIWNPEDQNLVDQKLTMAFGPSCKELQRPLRLWLPDKGIAFAAGEFFIEKSDGKVRLSPFSAAFYHKSKVPGAYPEISTIRCDMAILTLDRPVSLFSELSNRKVIGVEMVGRQPHFITLTNNRRTAEKNDDIDILITNGNLIYEERTNLISTTGVVCLTDHQSKPPMVISGRGLDMYLAKDSGPNRPRNVRAQPANTKSDNGNVEKIHLRSDVDMRFWVDAGSGFLGGTPNAKKPPHPAVALPDANPAPPEKAQIHIHTAGPFVYDLTKEIAWFESLPAHDGKAAKGPNASFAPDQVHVERIQKIQGGEKIDQLTCDRLDLQFRLRINASGANPPGEGQDKEIETAKATRRDVNEVVLALVSEGMDAFGNEMFYRAGDAVNGPLTILKGEPLRTAKDGHKMVCKELHLFAANRHGEGQRAWAKGPGQIDMLDAKNPDKVIFPTHVLWRDTLTVVKEKEGGKVFDLMTVVGEASFIDDLQKQELHGEKIVVWTEQTQESASKPDAVGSGRQKLHRVIAQDRVRAFSPEFIVRRSNRLTMNFLNEMARDARLPDLPQVEKKDAPSPPAGKDRNPVTPPVENKGPLEQKKPSAPIELEGNEITVAIATLAGKNQVQELISNGNVHVHQAGDRPGEKRLDILGTLLTVKHAQMGHTMIVYGDKDKPAQLDVGDTTIWGPIVTVNQADNKAEVDGLGTMDMPSNKNLDGTPSAKKNARIRIDWKKNMTFDGKYAVFRGGVQARESGAHSRALCEVLTAILDKTVSFKDGEKSKENAKIDRLVFDRNVFIEDYKFDEKKQPLQYNKLQGRDLRNQEEGPTTVTGPGWVRLLAKGSADQGFAPPQGAALKPAPAKLEWKLTHVKFRDSMTANTTANTKKATFYGDSSGVEVFHFPTLDIDANMDPDRPPKDGLYLRCEMLEVEGKQTADRTTHTMIARRNVYFRTDTYLGYADIVKYDESTDIVIFEGLNGNKAKLYKMVNGQTVPASPGSVTTTKVLYNRKTGQIVTEGVTSIMN